MANFKNFLEYAEKWTDPNMQKDLENFMTKFLTVEAQKILADTKKNTPGGPDSTGALRASSYFELFKHTATDYYVQFWLPEEYASYVEYGTKTREWKWKDGAFMLTKALNRGEMRIHKEFDEKFTKFLRDKGIG